MTVLVLERYPVDASGLSAFEELASRRVADARSAPGSLWAELYRPHEGPHEGPAEDPATFLLLSEWRTEADADAFEAASDLQVFDPALSGEVTTRRFTSPA